MLTKSQMECRRKKRYRKQLDAMLAIIRTGDKDRERSIYRCPHCHGWHLTSGKGRKRA